MADQKYAIYKESGALVGVAPDAILMEAIMDVGEMLGHKPVSKPISDPEYEFLDQQHMTAMSGNFPEGILNSVGTQ
jgi:hypothetical protein